jgi:hypothetical protein
MFSTFWFVLKHRDHVAECCLAVENYVLDDDFSANGRISSPVFCFVNSFHC